ncbi:MAG TPA: hypothetical protein VK963_01375, partial [Candidatus Saccharimonadales bacterium]|nr:hypothetical protein [Candidatus Saccharimonadales bacterium]
MKVGSKFGSRYQIIVTILQQPGYWRRLGLAWLAILSLFLWLRNINLFIYITTQSPLSAVGKLEFVIDVYGNFLIN